MSDWLKAFNPTAPINSESDALRAARASAVSIFIGVLVGIVSLVWSLTHPAEMQAAVAQASGGDANAAAMASAGAQVALWLSGALVVIQLIFGAVQWRDPKGFIAILFLVLLAYGLVSTAAAPALAGMTGVTVPIWQVALSLVIMVVQTVLHVAGLRGIKALDRIQMEAAR